MDFGEWIKLGFQILVAAVSGIAAVFGWVTKKFKEERLETDKRFLMIEHKISEMEANAERRREETEEVHRDLVELKATIKALPERREVAAIHTELKEVAGDLKGLAADMRAVMKETARTTEYLMSREPKS